MKKERLNDDGFSLIELIIVIAIMAVLAGVATISFIRYVDKSRESNCISMRKTMESEYLSEKISEESKSDDPDFEYTVEDYLEKHPDMKCEDGGTLEPSSDGLSIDCSVHGSLRK